MSTRPKYPAIHGWAGTCEAASPRRCLQKFLSCTAWGTGNLWDPPVSFCSRRAGSQLVSSSKLGDAESERQWGQCRDRAVEWETVAPCCYWGNEVNRHESFLYLNKAPISELHPGLHKKAWWYGEVVCFTTEQRDLSMKALIRPFVGLQSPKVSFLLDWITAVCLKGHLIPCGSVSDILGPLSLETDRIKTPLSDL